MGRRLREKPALAAGARVRVPLAGYTLEAVVVGSGGLIGGDMEYVLVRALHEDSYFGPCAWPVRELEVVPPIQTAARLRLPVNTRVRVRFPYGSIEARVTEDRGWILQGDSQLVRVRAVDETYYLNEFDIPADFLEVLPPEPRPARSKKKRPSPR